MSNYTEITNKQYVIDAPPTKDVSTAEEDFMETLSDQSPPGYSSQIRVELKDTSTFTNLSKGYIQVNLTILNGDNTALGANANVALANNASSLFSRSVVRLNNVVVESNELAHHSNHLKSLLNFSSDYANSVGSNFGVSPDTASHNSDANCLKPVNADQTYNETHNKGFYDRRKLAVAGVQSYFIPLAHLIGVANVNKVMINQVFALELTRTSDVEVLYGADSANCKIQINKLSLWLPRIKPSPLTEATIYSAISAGLTTPYMFHTWNCYDSNNFQSGSAHTQRVVSQSERPVWVLTYATLDVIAQTASPYHTPASSLTRVQARLNGKLLPQIEYTELNLNSGRSRAYNDLVKYSTSFLQNKDGILINRDDYEHNLVVAFDCRAMNENLSRSSNTIEIIASTDAGAGVNVRLHTCVVSVKAFDMTYGGGVPRITMM